MKEQYQAYLDLLTTLQKDLEQLSALSRAKIEAVGNDDLMALDAALKQEQALALSLRGLEQRREELLKALDLTGVTLTALPDRYPEDMRLMARRAVEALQSQWREYCGCAEAARMTLESNLHQIEKVLSRMDPAGHDPDMAAVTDYKAPTAPTAEPPKAMKTDFMA
jgi:hypothetical protein